MFNILGKSTFSDLRDIISDIEKAKDKPISQIPTVLEIKQTLQISEQ